MNSTTVPHSAETRCYYCNRNRKSHKYICKECNEILFNNNNINKTKCFDINKTKCFDINEEDYPVENSPPYIFHSGW